MRDPGEAALNELQKRCREATGLYEQAAESAGDDAVAALFRALASARAADARRLEACLAAMGELPEDVDTDAETLRKLVAAARTWLAAEESQALLREHLGTEDRILESARAALSEELTPQSRTQAERVRDEVEAARRLLRATLEERRRAD